MVPITTVPIARPRVREAKPPWPAGTDLADLTVLVSRLRGLGDVLFAVHAAAAFKAQNPSVELVFHTGRNSAEWIGLYDWCDEATPEVPDPGSIHWHADLEAIPCDEAQDRAALMGRMLGVEVERWADPPPFPPEADREAEGLGIPEGAVALGPWCAGAVPTRSFPSSLVETFADHLGRPVALFHSRRTPEFDGIPGLLNLSGQCDSELVLFAALRRCAAAVGVDAGLIHAALWLGLPTVGVYTHIEPTSRWGCAPPHVALVPDCDCFPCGDFSRPPPCHSGKRYAACANDVTPAQLVEALALAQNGTDERLVLRRTARGLEPAARLDALFVAPCVGAGGGERHLAQITAGLEQRGHRVGTLVTEGDDGQRELADRVGGRTIDVLAEGTVTDRVNAIRHALCRERPDSLVLYKRDWALRALDGMAFRPPRVVMLHHTRLPHERPLYLDPLARRFVDAHVCVSEAGARHLLGDGEDPRVSVIPHGVPVDELAAAESARREYGLPDGAFVFGMVGRIATGKNPRLLVEALATVPPDAYLLFVGSGDQRRDEARELAAELGVADRCVFAPARADVGPAYRALDLQVLPTDTEGAIPFGVLEAMAAGTPVAVTPVIPDFHDHFRDGEEILYIDGVVDSIDHAVRWAMDNREDLAALAAAGQRVVRERFGLERFVDAFEAAIVSEPAESATARPERRAPLPVFTAYPKGRARRALLVGGFWCGEALAHMRGAVELVADEVRHLPYMGEHARPELLRDALAAYDPDLILGSWWHAQDEESLDAMRTSPALKLWWNQDDPHRILKTPDATATSGAVWDVVLSSDDSHLTRNFYVSRLGKRLYWVPGVYPEDVDPRGRPDLCRKYAGGVLVAMSCYRKGQGATMLCGREEIVGALEAAGLPLNLWGGESWGREGVERLPYDEQFYAYDVRSNDVTVGHHIEGQGCHYLSDRDVHACGAGAFFASDRAGAIADVFREGEEAVYWSTPEELVELCREWLPRTDARMTVAAAARRRALALFGTRQVGAVLRDVIRGEGKVGDLYEATGGPARVVTP